jgi:hypothetical protein
MECAHYNFQKTGTDLFASGKFLGNSPIPSGLFISIGVADEWYLVIGEFIQVYKFFINLDKVIIIVARQACSAAGIFLTERELVWN